MFDGIAKAFRQYQTEMVEEEQASANPAPAGLEPETESEKKENKMDPEERAEGKIPKRK